MPLWRKLFWVLAGVATLSDLANAACTAPVVDLGYGKYAGNFNETSKITTFLGIRFAAPPQPPQPPAYVYGVQEAKTQPPTCFMAGPGFAPNTPFLSTSNPQKRDLFAPSEDCLFLNVYAPGALSQKKKLPVVVWIHGGGYMMGSAQGFTGADPFDGADLIKESNNGVIVVVIQYRLGVFGFLSGAKVKHGGALNAGLLDQQFALKWVQQNIQKFNGDPTQVTIWGESSGAGSVIQHVIANGGKTSPRLFRAAMTSSTFLPSQYKYNDRIPETIYKEVVAQTNCSSASDTLYCLRSVDANVLEAANFNIGQSGFYGTWTFVPVVDGEFIKKRPTEALNCKEVNGDVVLTVTNSLEGALFVNPNISAQVDVANYVTQLFPELNKGQISAAVSHYKEVGPPVSQVIAIMGEAIFVCPTYYLLNAFNGRGYKSQFAIPPAIHSNDLAYYFPSTIGHAPPPFNNAAFGKAFSQSFMDFAVALEPNVKVQTTITPKWKPWAGEIEMLFNKTENGEPDIHTFRTSKALLERCRFWGSVSSSTAQ